MTTIFTIDRRQIRTWFQHNTGETLRPTLESAISRLRSIYDDLDKVRHDLEDARRFNSEARIGNALDQLIHDSEKERLKKRWIIADSLLMRVRSALIVYADEI